MVFPALSALVPISGAVLGGYEGYRRSGGDLGAAALAAGLGAALPGGLRMAGTALGATPMGAAALGRGSQLLARGAQFAKIPGPVAPLTAAGLGAATAGVGSLFAPQLAGSIAAAATPPAQKLSGGATGLAVPAMQPSGQFNAGAAVPGGLPVGASPAGTLDVADPSGRFAAGRTAGLLEGDIQLANMKKLMPYLFEASEARSKTEMQRQLAAAGVRQNILTAANMLERSQQAAQQMGLNAASQAGAALTSQYQYQ
jgi:hypothetical protein